MKLRMLILFASFSFLWSSLSAKNPFHIPGNNKSELVTTVFHEFAGHHKGHVLNKSSQDLIL